MSTATDVKTYSISELAGEDKPLHIFLGSEWPVALCGYVTRIPFAEGLTLGQEGDRKVCEKCLRLRRIR